VGERGVAAIGKQAQERTLRCAAAFSIAEELDVTPPAVGGAPNPTPLEKPFSLLPDLVNR
jgi:hypothetical protein